MSSESMNLARFKKGAEVFEVVVDPDKAMFFRKGQNVDIRDVLKYPKVFSDAKKGMVASEQRMVAVFGTADPLEVSKRIILNGEVQVSSEYRKGVIEQKKRQLINIIHRNGVDPRTHAPHPITRLEAAFEEAKVRIDEFKSVEQQLPDVLSALRPIIPIKFEVKEIELKIPAAHAGKSYPVLKSFGKIIGEEWQHDGSWKGVVEIPGGLEEEFFNKLNSVCRGEVESKIVRVK